MKVFAHRPPALKHVMGLLLDLADEAVLPKRYLETALVTVSKLNESEYCVAHHEPRLVELGLAEDTVERILEPDCPGLDAVERLAGARLRG
ncbi:MAG: carboxymuconolactone decarboxylase family protein [Pseudomonadota bacterium]|nr:carboxymuconolactone decarboxylase family protein [Pseudomonadota bacterium]